MAATNDGSRTPATVTEADGGTEAVTRAARRGELLSNLRHLGAVRQLRRDTPCPTVLRQRFHCLFNFCPDFGR